MTIKINWKVADSASTGAVLSTGDSTVHPCTPGTRPPACYVLQPCAVVRNYDSVRTEAGVDLATKPGYWSQPPNLPCLHNQTTQRPRHVERR